MNGFSWSGVGIPGSSNITLSDFRIYFWICLGNIKYSFSIKCIVPKMYDLYLNCGCLISQSIVFLGLGLLFLKAKSIPESMIENKNKGKIYFTAVKFEFQQEYIYSL